MQALAAEAAALLRKSLQTGCFGWGFLLNGRAALGVGEPSRFARFEVCKAGRFAYFALKTGSGFDNPKESSHGGHASLKALISAG
jgi:hypothetical protein